MKRYLTILVTLFLAVKVYSQQTEQEALQQFRDMKFGMFVHWGPVTLRGTEIGWSRGKEVAVDDYDNLYKEFDPVLFNADEWIKAAKDAGMKYFVITTRHHDGFSLWDTKYSGYNIMNTPYGKDVLRQLKDACNKYGVMFGTYYSICDWHHPNYPLSHVEGIDKPEADMDKFYNYIKNQTKELIENYNTRILWFDGEWEEPWTHELGLDFYKYLKGLDSTVLINNRVDKGRKGMEGKTISDEYAGDFDTPEQRIGTFDNDNPWESCITICKQWSWKPNDKLKSYDEVLRTLLKTAGGGGNLLLNVSPMLDGRMERRQVERLKQIGNWLGKYGDSVYGTTGGPYKPNETMSSTQKGNRIFLHVFSMNGNELVLPLAKNIIVKQCSVMKGRTLDFTHKNNVLKIVLPEKLRGEVVTTVEVVLENNASDVPVTEVES
ncbi:MAG: alpha-L-fucosidase [Chlorobi bacterium]|nr:alpha-L-fucosidase [Chlorobiota bacterium]